MVGGPEREEQTARPRRPGRGEEPPDAVHHQVRVEHPAAREAEQVVLAHRPRGADAVAVQALGDALARQPGLGRLHPDQRPAREGALEAARVAVADLALGHPRDDSARGGAGGCRRPHFVA